MMYYISAGGIFMIPLLVLLLVTIGFAGRAWYGLLGAKMEHAAIARTNFMVLQLGVFAFFLGLFSQLLGLMQMLQAIQSAGDISPAMLAGGLYVSLIAPGFGLIILLLSLVSWIVCRHRLGV